MTNKQNENTAGGELRLILEALIEANSEGKPTSGKPNSFEFEFSDEVGEGYLIVVLHDKEGKRLDGYEVINTSQRKEVIKELRELGLTYISQLSRYLSSLVENAK